MSQLQAIGACETRTHLADLLRRVRTGQGFTITQRGEPVADLLPAGAGVCRGGHRRRRACSVSWLTRQPLHLVISKR